MSRSSTISSSASTSSFHEVGTPGSDSEDEIVYSVASLPELEQPQTPYMFSDGDEDDDDYVVLRRRPAGAQGFETATGSGVATPSAEGATRATSGRGSSSSGALRGQVMVVQLRSQLKALSINTQSPSTSTSPTTTKRTGTSTATSKKLQREDDYDNDDSELNANARASGLPTPDITPLKARIQRQPSGSTSLTGALIISELPNSPQSVATPTTTLPSVGKKKLKKKAKKAAALAAAKASTDSGSVAATTSDGVLKKGKKKKRSKSKKGTTTATNSTTSEAKQGKAGQVDRSMVLEASTYITSYVLRFPELSSTVIDRVH